MNLPPSSPSPFLLYRLIHRKLRVKALPLLLCTVLAVLKEDNEVFDFAMFLHGKASFAIPSSITVDGNKQYVISTISSANLEICLNPFRLSWFDIQ